MPDLAYTTQIEVDRAALIGGLRRLARTLKSAKAGEAVLRFEGGQLFIRIGGAEVALSATGRWSGEARVNGAWVLAIAQYPPATDPIFIRIEKSRLHLARLSVPCEWQETGAAVLQIPIEASIVEILRIGLDKTDDILQQSGIHEPIADARRQCKTLVVKAANALRPLGVKRIDVQELVNDRIRTPDVGEFKSAFLEPVEETDGRYMDSIEKAVETLSPFRVRPEELYRLVIEAKARRNRRGR
jgi:hypothetical protein